MILLTDEGEWAIQGVAENSEYNQQETRGRMMRIPSDDATANTENRREYRDEIFLNFR